VAEEKMKAKHVALYGQLAPVAHEINVRLDKASHAENDTPRMTRSTIGWRRR
jgi:hypothetical protein